MIDVVLTFSLDLHNKPCTTGKFVETGPETDAAGYCFRIALPKSSGPFPAELVRHILLFGGVVHLCGQLLIGKQFVRREDWLRGRT